MLKANLENHKKCHRTSAFSKVTIKLPKKKRRVRTESDDSGFGDPLAGKQDIVQSEIGPISVEKKVKVYSLKTHYKYCHSKGRTKKLLHEDADNGVAKQRLGGLDAQMPTMESSYNVSDEFEGAALMTMVGKMEELVTVQCLDGQQRQLLSMMHGNYLGCYLSSPLTWFLDCYLLSWLLSVSAHLWFLPLIHTLTH